MEIHNIKKRVGIATEYYGSFNCGGLLQAYALQRVISSLGFECEQICFESHNKNASLLRKLKNAKGLFFEELIGKILNKSKNLVNLNKRHIKIIEEQIKVARKLSAKKFSSAIPHSKKVYVEKTLFELNKEYDIFVCGSDQIWSPYWLDKGNWDFYFLTFANEKKRKIAYAASAGVSIASKEYCILAGKEINNLHLASVREESAARLLQGFTNKPLSVVADPTFLLSSDEWKSLLVKEQEEDYIFCYLLGDMKMERSISLAIGQALDKKIRFLPHAAGKYCKWDESFGDYQYEALNPEQFVNQIASSSFVITDSFHATVFSILFHKKFVVIPRDSNNSSKSTNSRLYDLLKLFKMEERVFSDTKNMQEKLDRKIDYYFADNILGKLRKESVEWLEQALEG